VGVRVQRLSVTVGRGTLFCTAPPVTTLLTGWHTAELALAVVCCCVLLRLQHVPLLSETLRMLATNDLSAAAYPYAAGSQVGSVSSKLKQPQVPGVAILPVWCLIPMQQGSHSHMLLQPQTRTCPAVMLGQHLPKQHTRTFTASALTSSSGSGLAFARYAVGCVRRSCSAAAVLG
jgi:hypothetical protein